MKEVVQYLKSKISSQDKIVVACSGGSDSMALLHLLVNNFDSKNVICAHVNHKVRKQSDCEYNYLEGYCKENNIVFEGLEIGTKIKKNFESEARKIRYTFFETVLSQYQAKYIITAHHADDLVETILMRLTRGSNLSGYAGIKKEDGKFLRPFIIISKKEILKYVRDNNIKYYEDYTNKLNCHTRNKYRNKIIPFLKKENNNLHHKYLKFSEELQDYDFFVNKYIDDKMLISDDEITLTKLKLESDFIKRKVLERLVKKIQKNDWLEISDKNIQNMIDVINFSKSNSIVNLSNGYIGKKSYNSFKIIKQIINNDFDVIFQNSYEDDTWIIKQITNSEEKSNNIIRLNSKEIKLPLHIRNRINGDVIELKNLGHKKVKDIFIDEKIDKEKRDIYPIVVDNNGKLIWVPGLKKSKFDKEKNEKYDIILFSERK